MVRPTGLLPLRPRCPGTIYSLARLDNFACMTSPFGAGQPFSNNIISRIVSQKRKERNKNVNNGITCARGRIMMPPLVLDQRERVRLIQVPVGCRPYTFFPLVIPVVRQLGCAPREALLGSSTTHSRYCRRPGLMPREISEYISRGRPRRL